MWPFSKREKLQILDLPVSGNFNVDVVGESHYQKQLKKICGGRTKNGHELEVKAILYCENYNKHDANAVCVQIDGLTVGYLSRADAKEHRAALEEQGIPETPVRCAALIRGGWSRKMGLDKGQFGVMLDLPED